MERQVERDLEILTAIEEGLPLTQRALAERLGVALGLCNLYLKRLARKGYIKIVEFPRKPAARKRLRYLLTPRGMAEKTRLTYEHMPTRSTSTGAPGGRSASPWTDSPTAAPSALRSVAPARPPRSRT
jgi:DNA-binding MarR family transcriptional regulator